MCLQMNAIALKESKEYELFIVTKFFKENPLTTTLFLGYT